jgi:hypothetical protein
MSMMVRFAIIIIFLKTRTKKKIAKKTFSENHLQMGKWDIIAIAKRNEKWANEMWQVCTDALSDLCDEDRKRKKNEVN